MDDNKIQVVSNGISADIFLVCIFTVLKLFNVISWSWWWVLSPIWIPMVIGIIIISAMLIVLISSYINTKRK